jgi:hypothetical protein
MTLVAAENSYRKPIQIKKKTLSLLFLVAAENSYRKPIQI